MDRARHHARQVSQGQGGQAACRLRHHVHRRRRARQGAPSAHTTPAPQPACRVHSRAMRIAHARGLTPALHCLASACPPARRTSASPRSASPATWCPPSSPPPPWRSSSVSSVRSRCERKSKENIPSSVLFCPQLIAAHRKRGEKSCLFDRVLSEHNSVIDMSYELRVKAFCPRGAWSPCTMETREVRRQISHLCENCARIAIPCAAAFNAERPAASRHTRSSIHMITCRSYTNTCVRLRGACRRPGPPCPEQCSFLEPWLLSRVASPTAMARGYAGRRSRCSRLTAPRSGT